MTKATDTQLSALGDALETFAKRFKLAEAASSADPLNEIDKQALLYVARHPECGPTDIARFLGTATTTVTSAADRLVRKGLLERGRPETDRRAVALRLSDLGRKRVDTILAVHREMYRGLLDPLSPEDRSHLIRIMTQISNTNIE